MTWDGTNECFITLWNNIERKVTAYIKRYVHRNDVEDLKNDLIVKILEARNRKIDNFVQFVFAKCVFKIKEYHYENNKIKNKTNYIMEKAIEEYHKPNRYVSDLYKSDYLDQIERIERYVAREDKRHRDVFNLVIKKDFSMKEACDLIGITSEQGHSCLGWTLKKIRNTIKV